MGRTMFRLLALIMLSSLGAASVWAQTDVAVGALGSVYVQASGNNQITTGNPGVYNSTERTTSAAGAIVEVRHYFSPVRGVEAAYSWSRANPSYSMIGPLCNGTVCPVYLNQTAAHLSASANEMTVDWVPSHQFSKHVRGFAIAGAGVLLTIPMSGQVTLPARNLTTGTTTSTNAVFVYGAGLDWLLPRHLGLRLQYRGNVYKAPNVIVTIPALDGNTNSLTHAAQMVAGISYRF